MKKPVVLCIMDGFGIRDVNDGNAIYTAKTPNLDKFFSENPFTTIGASGLDVGLPDGQMGNSEVGHTNIGAGRVVYQMLVKITKDIEDGKFFDIEVLKNAIENCKRNDSALHLIGLLSDGGVHSHIEHLYGLLKMAKKNGFTHKHYDSDFRISEIYDSKLKREAEEKRRREKLEEEYERNALDLDGLIDKAIAKAKDIIFEKEEVTE